MSSLLSKKIANRPSLLQQKSMSLTGSVKDMDADGMEYLFQSCTVIVIGASGDLAKKKTFPSLFNLYKNRFLPEHVSIVGYARSSMTDEELRTRLKPYIMDIELDQGNYLPNDIQQKEAVIDEFLGKIYYKFGGYDDIESFKKLNIFIEEKEKGTQSELAKQSLEYESLTICSNRLFYCAIPPTIFLNVAASIHRTLLQNNGWKRLVIEKPFGHDYESCESLLSGLGSLYSEEQLYRIDHYLGKEMVQNLMILRFGNRIYEPLWNKEHVKCVLITFKENFGTMGRGGYFDSSGIIRDILQNHLMQVLSLVAMEPPIQVAGASASSHIRDAKVNVLKCIEPILLDDVILGQYTSAITPDGKENPGYRDDPTVPKNSNCPTFCQAVVRIQNSRWDGVPFIMKAGKALDNRKAEIRIQFKEAAASNFLFDGGVCPSNELVIRLQPNEAIYLKTNIKAPGLAIDPLQSELDLNYDTRYPNAYNPDAYTRLLLDILRGQQATFVRDDELRASWRIWTPLLKSIEEGNIIPKEYPYGSRGPIEADERLKDLGFYHNLNYSWSSPRRKDGKL